MFIQKLQEHRCCSIDILLEFSICKSIWMKWKQHYQICLHFSILEMAALLVNHWCIMDAVQAKWYQELAHYICAHSPFSRIMERFIHCAGDAHKVAQAVTVRDTMSTLPTKTVYCNIIGCFCMIREFHNSVGKYPSPMSVIS